MEAIQQASGILMIVCGPAGSGKTTLCDRLEKNQERICRMVTTTSRQARDGEQEGVDYYFLSPEEFEKRIEAGEFIEWAKVHGRYYGSQTKHIMELLDSGKDILFNIDVQGAQTFSQKAEENAFLKNRLITVFIMPQSLEQLKERLNVRGTDSNEEIERRLKTAEAEIQKAELFDYLIESDTKNADYEKFEAIYESKLEELKKEAQ